MNFTLTALAIIPGLLIIIYIFKKDTVEKEPPGLLLKLLICGAISCIPAIFMEEFMDSISPGFATGSLAASMYMAFMSAGLCEELSKLGLLAIGSWRSKSFDYRFDGIVYGAVVAVGFATVENIMYVSQYGLGTALVRAFTSVPLHALCGVFMGVFYGAAKRASLEGKGGSAKGLIFLAFIVPMVIHGIYDTLAFMGTTEAELLLLAFVVLMDIVGISIINKFSKDDWKSGFYDGAQAYGGGYRSGDAAPRYGSEEWRNQYGSGYSKAGGTAAGTASYDGRSADQWNREEAYEEYEGNYGYSGMGPSRKGAAGSSAYQVPPEDTTVFDSMDQARAAAGNSDYGYQGGRSYGEGYGSGYKSGAKYSNSMSRAGFACGIISLLCIGGGPLPILAIIFGRIGKRRTPAGVDNPMARAAVWMGVIGLLLSFIATAGLSMLY